MNILFPIAEVAPIYKIGGLGDVGGALPKSLVDLGLDVRIALPLHPEINLTTVNNVVEASFKITYNHKLLDVDIIRTFLPGTAVPVYLFKEDVYLSKHSNESDNHADKFTVFSLAVCEWITKHSPYWQPHVIHCHDWHTALIPVILEHLLQHNDYKTVLTIHNLAYQGITRTPVVQKLAIDPKLCSILSWDTADGDLNILLEGLLHCDHITTVSPTYAKEILTGEYGEKIDHILTTKKSKITGILNGLDIFSYNPDGDKMLYSPFCVTNWLEGKAKNRQDLRRDLNLCSDPDVPLIGFVGRVDAYQKGIGLIIQAINNKSFPLKDAQFVFLGVGDRDLERQLHQAADNHPNIRIITRFDESLAHKIYAASHFTLIPSRFEPCGLVQLIAMRYGSVPIVRATGGLIDTVHENENGFLFEAYSADAMVAAVQKANASLDTELYSKLALNGLKGDYSWVNSAKKYAMLYQKLVIG